MGDEAGLRAAGITSGIATDVGGGTSYSMLQTLNEGYKILQLRGQKLTPLQAFHWATRGNAIALGMQDQIGTLAKGSDADLVVLAVPVGVMGEIAAEIAPHLKPGATVTDVGSVKQAVVDAVSPHLPEGVHFIPGHPMAGTEYSGPRSGFATLFQNRWWLMTPPEGCDPEALARLEGFVVGKLRR